MIEKVEMIIAIFGIILFFVILYFIPFFLWFRAIKSGVHIPLVQLIFMRLRKVPPTLIVNAKIALFSHGITVSTDQLEAVYLAGCNIENIIQGLIYAKSTNIQLTFKDASRLDLEKKDIVKLLSEIHKNKT
jgi:uncharacterized protein YqfA (UPF0365 family)